MNKAGVLFLAGILLAVLALSGCTQEEMAINFVKSLPEAQEFLSQNPDATVNANFVTKQNSILTLGEINKRCRKDIKTQAYWHINASNEGQELDAYINVNGTKALCIIKPEEQLAYLNECESDSECDDSKPCTIDNCTGQPRKCVNAAVTDCIDGDGCCPKECNAGNDNDCELQTCSEQGGSVCSDTEKCEQEFIEASDSEICCPEDCVETRAQQCGEKVCVPHEKCVDGMCIAKTCDERGGKVCAYYKICSKALVITGDGKGCCLGDCIEEKECYSDSDCGDSNFCTIDHCDSEENECYYTQINSCVDNDSCCPAGCNAGTDNDC